MFLSKILHLQLQLNLWWNGLLLVLYQNCAKLTKTAAGELTLTQGMGNSLKKPEPIANFGGMVLRWSYSKFVYGIQKKNMKSSLAEGKRHWGEPLVQNCKVIILSCSVRHHSFLELNLMALLGQTTRILLYCIRITTCH